MKYWRGYLIAAIFAACTYALEKFAEAHSALVDMFYPYVSRMAQSFLAEWSGSVEYCLWQVLLIALVVLALGSAVLMIVLKWNPVQWFGWILAAASVVVLLHSGMYGLNKYAGPLAEDIRLMKADYTTGELQQAAEYYRDQANQLAGEVSRDPEGNPRYPVFEELAVQAGEGFDNLTHKEFNAVFAGSRRPVKKLGWSKLFAEKKIGGAMVGITGEAAVNPLAPAAAQPFLMCEQMCRRMSIAIDRDALLGGFLACRANSTPEFRYSGYLMAYRFFDEALQSIASTDGNGSLVTSVRGGVSDLLARDLEQCNRFLGASPYSSQVCDLLVSLYVQEIILPTQQEEIVKFDPMDETQVDLSGIVNAPAADE